MRGFDGCGGDRERRPQLQGATGGECSAFSLAPVEGTTVLSQLTAASLGDGVGYYVVQFATVVLLALAANTSYGGLPTLMRILADDNVLPHRFARRTSRDVYRYGVLTLGIAAAVLLIGSGGNMNALVPLFAIGVFVGFTLAQVGMVRHWRADRTPGWAWRAALNGFGAVLTAVARVRGSSSSPYRCWWSGWRGSAPRTSTSVTGSRSARTVSTRGSSDRGRRCWFRCPV
ncbi:amino acid permease [Rhodococcus sp. NPDC059968]|uniref:amino acid permease n=1 Tax=Rhodococcus sp. NPDC059968 TaxID=3347017 RepID=UPI00366D5DD3